MALLVSVFVSLVLISIGLGYYKKANQNTNHLKKMGRIASEKGGKCLSPAYINASTKLRWECSEGHVWEATPNSIMRGRWCPQCAGLKSLDIGKMQEIAAEKGGWCLSEEYVDFSTNLRWECREHHVWEATPREISEGSWCPECEGPRRSSIEGMHELAAERGGFCLSTKYVNSLTKLKWECAKRHTWEETPDAIIQGSWCPECARAKRLTIEGMHELAAERGGHCLSDKYVNSTTKLSWQCGQGHVWEATPRAIRQGGWCPECLGTKRLTIEEMRSLAEERGGKCLSDKYVSLSTKVKWQCSKGHVWEATTQDIRRGNWCPECLRED